MRPGFPPARPSVVRPVDGRPTPVLGGGVGCGVSVAVSGVPAIVETPGQHGDGLREPITAPACVGARWHPDRGGECAGEVCLVVVAQPGRQLCQVHRSRPGQHAGSVLQPMPGQHPRRRQAQIVVESSLQRPGRPAADARDLTDPDQAAVSENRRDHVDEIAPGVVGDRQVALQQFLDPHGAGPEIGPRICVRIAMRIGVPTGCDDVGHRTTGLAEHRLDGCDRIDQRRPIATSAPGRSLAPRTHPRPAIR